MGIENPNFNLGAESGSQPVNPSESVPEATQLYQRHERLLGTVVSQIDQDEISALNSKKMEMTGEYDGIPYTIRRPSVVSPGMGFVGLVDINASGDVPFSCVIKREQESMKRQAAEYQKHIARHPIMAKFVPKLYGMIDNWAVMEKISGLEAEEVEDRMKQDSAFTRNYARQASLTIKELADNKLGLRDVRFVDGHNCMVDPNTAQHKFIEIKNVEPSPYLEANELATEQLIGELDQVAQRPESHRLTFTFELLQNSLRHTPADQLAVRARAIKPTHPRFKNAYYVHNQEPITNDLYNTVLKSPDARERFTMPLPETGDATIVISPELIAAVQSQDREKFGQLITEKKYKMRIEDKTHPLYEPLIVPDSVA